MSALGTLLAEALFDAERKFFDADVRWRLERSEEARLGRQAADLALCAAERAAKYWSTHPDGDWSDY